MAGIKRSEIVAKLNDTCRRALENAVKSAKLRGNPYVELVHFIEQLALTDNSDIQAIARHFDVDMSRFASDLTRAVDELPRGSTSISDFSDHIFDTIERGWVNGSMRFNDDRVRSGYALLGAMRTPGLDRIVERMSDEFAKIRVDDLEAGFPGIVSGSLEDRGPGDRGSDDAGSSSPADVAQGRRSALASYGADLTAQARSGAMDPIVGRDAEIRQIVNILMRRRQNNPILTGEAGVGKTAVVEGFAQRIAEGDVPPQLRDVSLWMLDIGLLQAGASMKGEFESRLRQVIDEVQASETPIILFIDEAHTLIGAGGQAGTGDAANLLKPALARGTLRTVAATTWAEYKKHIEKDPALTRRFEVVKIEEPTEDKALLMMRGVASVLETHHRVQVLDEALEAAVQLSHRYIPARQLPDKSVSLLDTACARVAVSQHATPPEVEDVRRRISGLEVEKGIVAREAAIGLDDDARAGEIDAAIAAAGEELEELEARWERERTLVDEILALRAKLRGDAAPVEGTHSRLERQAAEVEAAAAEPVEAEAAAETEAPETAAEEAPPPEEAPEFDRDAATAELREKLAALAELQGETPLIMPTVDAQAVAAVVQDWTGIPVGRMLRDEIAAVLTLGDRLAERVIGQDHALQLVARRIQTSRAGLTAPNKPIGVFLLCGPSGVGKTETALALAETLYGGEQNLITINMSEFQEAHTVSTLKGAPPGYVGYGEGGVLTEAVRRRPYSVVLLDEVEKAHSDVHEIFFQVFDKGVMEDGEGRSIDFRNTLILLTSNVGSDLIMKLCEDPDLAPEADAIAKALREPLLKVFPAALLGRLSVIPYYPLTDEMIDLIARLQLRRIQDRVREAHGADLVYDDDVLKLVRERCTEIESGGRMIDAILTNTLLPTISREVLARMSDGRPISRVAVGAADGQFTYAID